MSLSLSNGDSLTGWELEVLVRKMRVREEKTEDQDQRNPCVGVLENLFQEKCVNY